MELRSPAKISVLAQQTKHTPRHSYTRDISAGGASFEAIPEGLNIGTRLEIRFFLYVAHLKKIVEEVADYVLLKTIGTVVRIDHTGFAVCFDEECVFA